MLLFGWDVLDTKEAISVKLLDVVITYRDVARPAAGSRVLDQICYSLVVFVKLHGKVH